MSELGSTLLIENLQVPETTYGRGTAMHVIWGDRVPVGLVRRYALNELRVPVNNERFTVLSGYDTTTLIHSTEWLAGYQGDELIAVVRERCGAATHAACGVAFFTLSDKEGTELMRWDLSNRVLEPLVRVPHRIHWLGCTDDATSIVDDTDNVVTLYDGRGAVRWTRELPKPAEDAPYLGSRDHLVVEGDVVTLYYRDTSDDYPDHYASIRIAPDRPIERLDSETRPAWYPALRSRRSEYRVPALSDLAISRDGTQVATARNAWTRPEGALLPVPAIYDSSESSSWGGEALVHDLAYTDDGELLRLSARIATWMLDRCSTGACEHLDVESARLLPGTDRLIKIRKGTIALGDRVLMEAGREARVSCAADGSVIAIQLGSSVTVFDPTGEVLRRFEVPGWMYVVGPHGNAVVCHMGSGFVVVRATGEIACTHLAAAVPAFSPDGTHIAFGFDWRLRIHNLVTQKAVRTEELPSPVTGVAFSREGVLFSATADGCVIEWDLELP